MELPAEFVFNIVVHVNAVGTADREIPLGLTSRLVKSLCCRHKNAVALGGVILVENNCAVSVILESSAAELVADLPERVYPGGRLDCNSEGMLLLTNDGELANALMHPKKQVDKTYLVWVSCFIAGSERALAQPSGIVGRLTSPAEVLLSIADGPVALLRITIHEGRNRQIRRLCERAGLTVTRLRRIQEGPLQLGDLRPGQSRPLTQTELERLFEEIQK